MATPEGIMLTAKEPDDIAWAGVEGSAHRNLTAREVAELQAYADRITADEVLVPAGTDAYGRELPAVTRLSDLHQNWDAQHPLLRDMLKAKGLHPKG